MGGAVNAGYAQAGVVDVTQALFFHTIGVSPTEVAEWVEAGVDGFKAIAVMRCYEMTPGQVVEYRKLGVGDLRHITMLHSHGVTPRRWARLVAGDPTVIGRFDAVMDRLFHQWQHLAEGGDPGREVAEFFAGLPDE